MNRAVLSVLLALSAAIRVPSHAQQPSEPAAASQPASRPWNQDGLFFGWSIARLRDFDADGIDELAIFDGSQPGGVFVVSADAKFRWYQTELVQPCGWAGVAAVSDADGDGADDWVAAISGRSERRSTVELRSGRSGAPIWAAEITVDARAFSVVAAELGDVDGDSVPDVLVGDPFGDQDSDRDGTLDFAQRPAAELVVAPGRVLALSGKTGAILWVALGRASGSGFGYAVGGGRDVSGDGVPDALVSRCDDSNAWRQPRGSALLLDGRDGSVLRELFDPHAPADAATSGFGTAVRWLDDINGDGVAEIAIGALHDASSAGWGRVYVFCGRTSTLLWAHKHFGEGFGSALWPAGDFDRDGAGDLLVGMPESSSGGAALLSACNRKRVRPLYGETSDWHFGTSGSSLGDVDHDGAADVAVARIAYGSLDQPGLVRFYSGANARRLGELDLSLARALAPKPAREPAMRR